MWSSSRLLPCVVAVCAVAVAGCSGVRVFLANDANPIASFKRTVDQRYGEDARQRLDVYSPRHSGFRPVVVFFYGGTWSGGEKADYAFVGAALASQGYVTVIADYRVYPEVKFPTFIEDGARAVAWA